MAELPQFALSINQPWAWLIAAGLKDIENRNWKTDFRGEFLIHAGLALDRECAHDLANDVHPLTGYGMEFGAPAPYQRGGMVGIAEIVDCVTRKGSSSEWFVGRFGFVIRNARPIEMIPCVGALGFFRPDYSRTYAPRPEPKAKAPKPLPVPEPAEPDLFGEILP